MAISIAELRYFQKAAELENITAAAEQLHVAQPSLSRSINAMEASLGVDLFDRVGRNITLNTYGKIVKSYADRILSQLDSMQTELDDALMHSKTTVSIQMSAASTFLPSLLSRYKKLHPDARFDILQQDDANTSVSYDLKLFSSPYPVENDYTVSLLKERLLLAIPGTDPRAKNDSVRLSDFASSDFIMLYPGKGLRILADEFCHMADFEPKIILESDAPSTVREFIKAGYGVSFVPEVSWYEVRGENIALMPIESPKCNRYICMSWNHTGYLSKTASDFKNFLIENFENHAYATASIALQEDYRL